MVRTLGSTFMASLGTHERLDREVQDPATYEGTVLDYRFEGEVAQNRIEGTVNLGEYGNARWTATKHEYGAPDRTAQRPIKPA